MAYSFTDIPTLEQTDAAADKPLTVGTSVIEGAKDNTGFDVRWVADGDIATTDDEDTSFPHKRSYDRHWHIVTKPTTAAVENWLVIKSGTSVKLADFDSLLISGHNLGANSSTIDVRISDGADMAAAGNKTVSIHAATPAAATGNNESRLVDLVLTHSALKSFAFDNGVSSFTLGEQITGSTTGDGVVVSVTNGATGTIEFVETAAFVDNEAVTGADSAATCDVDGSTTTPVAASGATAQVYSDVQYIGIRITQAGSIKSEIGDVWLGKRRQMPKSPRLGYNPDFSRSNVARFQSESMVTTSYVRARGQQVLTASMTTTTAAMATVMTTFYNDIEEGTKSFVWVEKPNASPTVARVMLLDSPELHGGDHIANTSATNAVRPWTFQMSEQAPFLDREG